MTKTKLDPEQSVLPDNPEPTALEKKWASNGVAEPAPAGNGELTQIANMIERLALTPEFDVGKFERLIALYEKQTSKKAREAFTLAFSNLQGELPAVDQTGDIIVKGVKQSTYATNDAIQAACRPVLQRHGFTLSFRAEFPDKGTVKVIGVLAHAAGHSEQTEFVSAADTSGNKNAIQALASTMTYGQRYCTKFLLNIVTAGDDDDGRTAGDASGSQERPAAPAGYSAWSDDLAAAADEGTDALKKCWTSSKAAYRDYTVTHYNANWEQLKRKAAKVGVL